MVNKEKAFNVETPDDSSGFLLWQVTNLWQHEIKKALQSSGLTHPQFVLLASTLWLSQFEKNITQVMLSNHTKIDPMTTSTVLRALEKENLLKRKEHLTDTRAKTVELTEAGKKIAQEAVKTVAKFDDDFFKPLGEKTPGFNQSLSQLLG